MANDEMKERLRALAGRIQESSAWQQLSEKFHDLSPTAQKAALASGGALIALLLFLLPWAFYSSSQNTVEEFENKKKLVRDLYRVSHAASRLPIVPQAMSAAELRSAVQNALASERPTLLPEQTISINDFDNSKEASSALPKSLKQDGLIISLSRLNLDQVVKIGTRLASLRPTTKLIGYKVQSTAADPHYFDVTAKVVAFNVPAEPVPAATKPGAAKKAAPQPGAKDKAGEGD